MASQRKFDHDEARRLRAEGLSYAEIARRMGVTDMAVLRVCDETYRRRDAIRVKAWTMSGVCEICGGSCVRANHPTRTSRDGRVLCAKCRGKERREGIAVRGGEIVCRCSTCETWKPLVAYLPRTARAIVDGKAPSARRCRDCEVAKRREYRNRHKIPCVECGQLRLAPNETGGARRGYADSGLCRGCFLASLRRSREVAAA